MLQFTDNPFYRTLPVDLHAPTSGITTPGFLTKMNVHLVKIFASSYQFSTSTIVCYSIHIW